MVKNLKPLVLSLLLTVLVGACTAPDAERNAGPADAPQEGVLAQPETMARFFPAASLTAAREYVGASRAATSASDLAALYRQALALETQLLGPIRSAHAATGWPLLEDFIEADLGLPGLAVGCVAECTEPALRVLVPHFSPPASPPGNEEEVELFFHLLDKFYGSEPRVYEGRLIGWPSFFEPTWDYGGHSLLGEGRHLLLLQQIESYLKREETTFREEVLEFRQSLMTDLLSSSSCSGLPAEDILSELDGILDATELQDDERATLTRRRAAFEDPQANGNEVGCREMNCTCNTG
jgi:hypothetical protein